MCNAEQLAELPTRSRMAWSSRSVWDRRAPQRRGRSYQSDLDRVGRGGNRYRPDRHNHRRSRLLASKEPMVTEKVLIGGRHG